MKFTQIDPIENVTKTISGSKIPMRQVTNGKDSPGGRRPTRRKVAPLHKHTAGLQRQRATHSDRNNNNYLLGYMVCNNNNLRRADPLQPAWCHPTEGQSPRASPEYTQFLPASGSPNPRFPPYAVRQLHVRGAAGHGR